MAEYGRKWQEMAENARAILEKLRKNRQNSTGDCGILWQNSII